MKKILLTVIVACTGFSGAQADKAKVGVILTLSGTFSAVGEDGKRGIALALAEEKSEPPFEILYGDSRGEPTTAVTEFRKLVNEDKVSSVYVFRGPPGMAVNPISKQMKIPLLGGVGNASFTEQNDLALQVWPSSDFEGDYLAKEMVRRGAKRVGIVTAEDDWTLSLTDGVKKSLTEGGVEIASDQVVQTSDGDFRTLVAKLVSAKVDAVFVNVSIAQLGPLIKQIREARISIPVYSNFWVGKKEVADSAGDAVKGAIYDEMAPDMPLLAKAAQEKFATKPNGALVSAYLAMKALIQIYPAGAASDAAAISERLKNLKVIATPDGPFEVVNRKVIFKLRVGEVGKS